MPQPSWEEQVQDWKLDLQADITCALRQAENGPFFPEKEITAESLRAYAETCRLQLAKPDSSLLEALKGSGIPRTPVETLLGYQVRLKNPVPSVV